MVFAMRSSIARVTARLEERLSQLTAAQDRSGRLSVAELMLEELLPLDESRREEATVWLEFTTAARTRPELRPHAEEAYDGMRKLVRRIVDGASRHRPMPEDPEVETERLCALIDGLTVAGVLHPARMTPALMVATLRRHLGGLATPDN